MMRVLYLNRIWAMGGATSVISLILPNLPSTIEIIHACYDAPGGADDEYRQSLLCQGQRVLDECISWSGMRDWFQVLRTIDGLVKKYDIDLIHTHENQSNTLVGLHRRRWPCACVATAYGWWEVNLKLSAYYALERRFALPRFERVTTVSEDMKHKLTGGGVPAAQIRVIPTGMDVTRFAYTGDRHRARAAQGLGAEDIVIGTVSRLAPEKGHGVLLHAASRLVGRYPNLRILIVGIGPERSDIEALSRELALQDRIKFTGFYGDLVEAYAMMDIFALPSVLEEGFPTVTMEAQAAGLPVVASDIGGTRETVEKDTTGFLAAPRSPESLAAQLDKLLADRELRLTMAAAARRRIAERFPVADMARKVAAVYEEALAERLGAGR